MRLLARFLTLLLLTAVLAVGGLTSPSPAGALAAPVVDPPRCFPRFNGVQYDCYDVLPNGTYGPLGMSASVSGTATPGGTFSVSVTPRIAACTSHEQRGCYDAISHGHDGGLFYLPYANSLLTQRAVKWMEKPMSTHAPTLRSVLPEPAGSCEARWNGVYADGYDFAGRAQAVRTCTFRFKYQNAAGEQVILDNLLGPTWLRVWSSVTVRKPEGGIESETMVSLVRVDGELARGPVAHCTPPDTPTAGARATFRSSSSVTSDLDSVATWAFQPGLTPQDTYHGGTSHNGWAHVVPTAPGTLKATLTLQSWQGTSQSVCSVVVAPGTGGPDPDPEPTPGDPPITPAPPVPPALSCGLSGSPSLAGKTRAGKKIKVDPGPWAVPGAELTYRWKVGGKKAGKPSARAVRLTSAQRGAKVTVRVSATAPGCPPHSVTLKAGKVR